MPVCSLLSDLRDEEESVLADDFDFPISKTKTSRQWTPMDNYNPEYIQQLQVQKVQGTKSDYERGNKVSYYKIYQYIHCSYGTEKC